MHSVPPESERCASALEADQNLTCSECGKFGATDFGHTRLCLDCYAEQGACCALEREERSDEETKFPEADRLR